MQGKITKTKVDALRPGQVLHDKEIKGFVARCAYGKKLTQPVDSIDMAYRIAAKTVRDVASLLLLASLNVSQRIETISAGARHA